jgi:hypothetical protein
MSTRKPRNVKIPPLPKGYIAVRANTRQRRRNFNPDIPNIQRPRISGRVKRPLGRNRLNRTVATMMLRKEEFWIDVKPGVFKYTFQPGRTGIAHLDRFSSIYEMYRVQNLKIHFRSSSGTTTPGNITLGFDYSSGNERTDKDIKLLDPVVTPIFQNATHTAVPSKIMKGKRWLYTSSGTQGDVDSTSFALYVNTQTEAKSIGQIWITYSMHFSTATSVGGTPGAEGTPVSLSISEVAANVQISPSTDVEAGVSPNITLHNGSTTIKVDVDGSTTQSTEFAINQTIPVGSQFSAGTSIPDAMFSSSAVRASPPKISFTYSDGTPVPTDVISQVTGAPMLSDNIVKQRSVFASIFAILKPLLRPVIMTVLDIFLPPASYSSVELLEDEPQSLLDIDPAQNLVFAFEGTSATITVPAHENMPIASRLATSLMTSVALGTSTNNLNYVYVYSVQEVGYPNNWLTSFEITGGTGAASFTEAQFTPPPTASDVSPFGQGDIVVVSLLGLQFDQGIGVTVKTPFAVPLNATELQTLITRMTANSYLKFGDTKINNMLRPLYSVNNSNVEATNADTGMSIVFRIAPNSELKSFDTLVLAIPNGDIVTKFNNRPTGWPSPTPHRPNEQGSTVGVIMSTFEFFPASRPQNSAASLTTEAQFALTSYEE